MEAIKDYKHMMQILLNYQFKKTIAGLIHLKTQYYK